MSRWEKVRLGDVCELITDGTHQTPTYVEEGYIFLSSKNVVFKNIDWENVKYIPEELHNDLYKRRNLESSDAPSRAKQIIIKNDILVSTVRPNLNSVAINQLETDTLVVASTGFCIIRCKENVDYHYIFKICTSEKFINDIVKIARGASYPAVSVSDIMNVNIPIPPLQLQKQFANIVEKIEGQKSIVKKGLNESQYLFYGLMSQYFY